MWVTVTEKHSLLQCIFNKFYKSASCSCPKMTARYSWVYTTSTLKDCRSKSLEQKAVCYSRVHRNLRMYTGTCAILIFCTKAKLLIGNLAFFLKMLAKALGRLSLVHYWEVNFDRRAFYTWNSCKVSQTCLTASRGSRVPRGAAFESLCAHACPQTSPQCSGPGVLALVHCLPSSCTFAFSSFMAHCWFHTDVHPSTKWYLAAPGSLLLLHTSTHT